MAESGYCLSALLSICFLMNIICSAYSTEFVPVFMWESLSKSHPIKEVPALATVSADDFKHILMEKLERKPVVVIFAEENLSVEDFTWQNEAGQSAFPNLENISAVADGLTYLPFVHAPLRAFHHHLPLHQQDWHHLKLGRSGFSKDAVALNETLFFVHLDDATGDEDRLDLLKRHDAVISQMFSMLAEHHRDVLAVYTAHHSSWSDDETLTRRVRNLLATDLALGDRSGYGNNDTLLYAPTMILTVEQEESITLANGTVEGNEDLVISFPDNITVTFSFENTDSPGYWSLRSVIVTVDDKTYAIDDVKVGAPLEFSYHCSQGVILDGRNMTLNINSGFQIQPYADGRRFGAAYDCVYFFTVPIWSGIFVCVIFSIIMIFGLGMIMDIKSMDSFDDPKGKTITITASE
ncbi:V-type proton ATPase subunit S1-like isoform X2 [Zootermopsis nevadensis]|uniref:V-type proton ATPase subunit S1 n=1 Tax=Zootermopsis nevadensis TaxID=136037 RepID=A0A067QVB5_ZOONE|nr:V-type proton ATPase subunit S1-like isoform X2 [Zootermopsis nevadensis]KDR13979.1 V-type proton ATPase subunit S1 [Zootermopsis nevadensis]